MQDLYKKLYNKNPLYGSQFHGRDACQFIANTLKPNSILDVGCGNNEFCIFMREKYSIYTIGIDFAAPKADIIGDCHNLPCNNKSYDMITCFDVMEHLKEKSLLTVFEEFKRVSIRWLFFSISYTYSRSFNGKQLHLTVKKEKQWIKKLSNFIKVEKYKKYLWGQLI